VERNKQSKQIIHNLSMLKQRKHSVGRKIILASPYSNETLISESNIPRNANRVIKLNPIRILPTKTLYHFSNNYAPSPIPISQRPSTRKESRGDRLAQVNENDEDKIYIGPMAETVFEKPSYENNLAGNSKFPNIVQHLLHKNDSKEDINPNNGQFRIVVTRGKPKEELFIGDYQSNMNLQNYDFNKQKRLATAISRGRSRKVNQNQNEIIIEKKETEGVTLLTQSRKTSINSNNNYEELQIKKFRSKKYIAPSESPHKNYINDYMGCQIKKRCGINIRGSIINSNAMRKTRDLLDVN